MDVAITVGGGVGFNHRPGRYAPDEQFTPG